jgi:hypothetical protein
VEWKFPPESDILSPTETVEQPELCAILRAAARAAGCITQIDSSVSRRSVAESSVNPVPLQTSRPLREA